MMRQRQERDERTIRCVRFSIAANGSEKHRFLTDGLAVFDHWLGDRHRLRYGNVADIDELFDLKVDIELVRHSKHVSRGRQPVERLKKQKEQRANGP